MKQKTTAQIREEIRKDMNKLFEKKYKYLSDDLERYKNLYHTEMQKRVHKNYECAELKEENAKLKEKITQYEDWIERLHDFMNIEKERENAFKTYVSEMQSRAEFESLMGVYTNMFNKLFSF